MEIFPDKTTIKTLKTGVQDSFIFEFLFFRKKHFTHKMKNKFHANIANFHLWDSKKHLKIVVPIKTLKNLKIDVLEPLKNLKNDGLEPLKNLKMDPRYPSATLWEALLTNFLTDFKSLRSSTHSG